MKKKFTLKNLKVCEWASEETTCFTATMYVDGKRVGECSNDGHGGAHRYEFNEKPYVNHTQEWLWNDYNNSCKKYNWTANVKKQNFVGDFDALVNELITQSDFVKQIKSYRNKAIKKNPTKADVIVIYIDGDFVLSSFAGSEHEVSLLAKYPTAVLAPLEASLSI